MICHTLPAISQIHGWLGDDNRPAHAAAGAVDAEFEEDVVQHVLHDIPVAHDTTAGLEGRADLPSRRSVNIGILSNQRVRL